MMSAYTLPTARTNSGSRGKKTQQGREESPGHARCISLLTQKLTILGALESLRLIFPRINDLNVAMCYAAFFPFADCVRMTRRE